MRGLPPIPPDVAHIELDVTSDDARWSVGFWILLAPEPPYALVDIKGVLGNFVIAALPFVNALTSHASQVRTCRLQTVGPQSWSLVETVAANVGALGGNQANQVATAIHWLTTDPGRAGQAMTFMGGFADDFTDDHLTLNDVGMNDTRNAAVTFNNQVNTITFGSVLQVTLGTVHRSRGGAPLAVSVFSPFVGISPARKLGTIRRRMYLRR